MTDKVKQLAPTIWAEIQKSTNVLLHLHPSPDGDSIGGALAMMHVLKNLGKQVTLIGGDSALRYQFSSLPGFNEIKAKNFFEISINDFDTFIVQDSSNLDVVSKKGEVIFPVSLTVIAIDHHINNVIPAKISLVEPVYPANSQLLFDLFKEWQVPINKEIAICLYIGIYSDTLGFKIPNTNPDSFLAAYELTIKAPNFPSIVATIEEDKDPQKIKIIGLALSSVEYFFNNKVAISFVTQEQLQKINATKTDIEGTRAEISQMLKSVREPQIVMAFIEYEPDHITCSIRSKDPNLDVSLLARTAGEGGGHVLSSGASIYKPFAEAKEYMLNILQKLYPDLGTP